MSDDPDVIIESERQVTVRNRDAQDHSHRMAVTVGAFAVLLIVLISALYQLFVVGPAEWATAAVGSSLTAAVAFLFSRER